MCPLSAHIPGCRGLSHSPVLSEGTGTICRTLSDTQPFYCSACDQRLVDATALRQHLQDKVHVKPKKKALRDCKKCNKSFASTTALRQHEQSTSHKPLAELCCVAESCRLTFNTPSALIHHLESGRCPSGCSRQTVNAILQRYDKDRILTTPVMLLDMSFMGTTLSSSASSFSDVVYTPTEWSETDSDWEMERSPIAPSPPGVDHGPVQHSLPHLFCKRQEENVL
jgi:hypothetical protein